MKCSPWNEPSFTLSLWEADWFIRASVIVERLEVPEPQANYNLSWAIFSPLNSHSIPTCFWPKVFVTNRWKLLECVTDHRPPPSKRGLRMLSYSTWDLEHRIPNFAVTALPNVSTKVFLRPWFLSFYFFCYCKGFIKLFTIGTWANCNLFSWIVATHI